MSKGGSKVLTGIIAFIIGFIFAILAEVAAIIGVYVYISNARLDDLFGMLNVQNKDENGNYIYINTDKDNGGVQTLKELLGVLYGYIFSDGAASPDYPVAGKSFAEIEKVLPVTGGIVSQLSEMIGPYIRIDWDEFKATPFTDLAMYMSDCLMETRPAESLSAMAEKGLIDSVDGLIGEDANVLVKALIAGAETEYAQSETLSLPVFCDTFTYNAEDDNYYRTQSVDNTDLAPTRLGDEFFVPTDEQNEDGEQLYKLYYVPCSISGGVVSEPQIMEGYDGNGFDEQGNRVYEQIFADGTSYLAVIRGDDGKFSITEDMLSNVENYKYNSAYGDNYISLTGNYFKRADGTQVQVNPVTMSSLTSAPFDPLHYVPLIDFIGDYKVTADIFSGETVGDLMDGNVDFDSKIQGVHLSAVISDVRPDNKTLMYIVYNVTDVYEADGVYRGVYDADGQATNVTIQLDEGGFVSGVFDADGNEMESNTVSSISSVSEDLTVTVVIEPKADDAVMSYIGYGITNLREESGTVGDKPYTHVGRYSVTQDGTKQSYECYVDTKGGNISSAWYYDGDGQLVKISPTTVNTLSDRISNITSDLTIGSMADITADSAIMAYMGYGITGVRAEQGADYQYVGTYADADGVNHTCYIRTETDETSGKDKIVSVWYEESGKKVYIDGTAIDGISAMVETLPEKLTIGSVVDITTDPIIAYVGYGISGIAQSEGITEQGDSYTHTGKFTPEGAADSVVCYISAAQAQGDADPAIESVWYYADGQKVYIDGTPINGISSMAAGITDDLTIGELIHIDENSSNIIKQLRDSKISELSADIDNITIQSIYTKEIYGREDAYVASEYRPELLYYVMNDGVLELVNRDDDDASNDGRLTLEQWETGTFYTYGEATGMWKLILYVNGSESVYTINNFHNMINSAAQNVNSAKLYELQEAGILTVSKEQLDKHLKIITIDEQTSQPKENDYGVLGELQLRQLIDIVVGLAAAV